MLFNEILKGLREERGLTQKNIADACKVSPTCICQLETGSRSPTGSTLLSLADFFNCSIDYLLGREDDFGNIVVQTQKPTENTFDGLSAREQKLIEQFRFLKEGYKVLAEKQIKMIVDYQKEEPIDSNSNAFTTVKKY